MNLKVLICFILLAAAGCCAKKTDPRVAPSQPTEIQSPDCSDCGEKTPLGGGFGQTLPIEAPEKESNVGFQPIYFDTNKAEIKASERRKLDEIVAFLKSKNADHIRVYGHCDERGTREFNVRLSRRRVNSVIMYLNHKLNKPDYEVYALGEDSPTCTERTVKCWALNRRVEITAVLPQ